MSFTRKTMLNIQPVYVTPGHSLDSKRTELFFTAGRPGGRDVRCGRGTSRWTFGTHFKRRLQCVPEVWRTRNGRDLCSLKSRQFDLETEQLKGVPRSVLGTSRSRGKAGRTSLQMPLRLGNCLWSRSRSSVRRSCGRISSSRGELDASRCRTLQLFARVTMNRVFRLLSSSAAPQQIKGKAHSPWNHYEQKSIQPRRLPFFHPWSSPRPSREALCEVGGDTAAFNVTNSSLTTQPRCPRLHDLASTVSDEAIWRRGPATTGLGCLDLCFLRSTFRARCSHLLPRLKLQWRELGDLQDELRPVNVSEFNHCSIIWSRSPSL